MRQGAGISTSLAAILSSFTATACSFPIGFTAALGVGTASAFFTTLRLSFLGFSIALIGFGFWQQHRAKHCAVRGRWLANVFLWASVVLVMGVIFFPQQVAELLANLPVRSAQ